MAFGETVEPCLAPVAGWAVMAQPEGLGVALFDGVGVFTAARFVEQVVAASAAGSR